MDKGASINAETKKLYIFIILRKEGWIMSINYVKIILCQRKGTGDHCVFCIKLLNIHRVNTHILFNMTGSEEAVQNRRQFLKHFAVSLMRPHLQA